MTRIFIALFCTVLFAQAHSPNQTIQVFPGRTGLVLIASAPDGFSVATDGAQRNADGTTSQADKLFAVGKEGVVAIAGTVSIQDPMNRPVRQELNVSNIVRTWIDSHPQASLDSGVREISALVSSRSTSFFSTRNPGKAAGRFSFALVFAGYSNGKPVLAGTRYFMPAGKGKAMKTEPISVDIKPGKIFVFGPGAVARELLRGTSARLNKFKADPAIRKYRSTPPGQMTAADYQALFQAVIQATESPEGRKLAGAIIVASPNKFATVGAKEGVVLK